MVWLGATGTAVLIGVLVNVLSTQAQRVVPPPTLPSTGAVNSLSGSPKTKGPPLRVLSEDQVDSALLLTVAFPEKLILSEAKLSELQPGIVPKYLYSLGGYPTYLDTQLVVQNNRNYPIQILNMSVEKSCHAPFVGTLFYEPSQGAIESVQIGFDLDSSDTEAKVAVGPAVEASSADYFSKYTVSIGPLGKQVLDIATYTTRYSCTFRYQLVILDGEKKVFQTIGNGGKPFKVDAVLPGTSRHPFDGYSAAYVVGNFGIPGDLNGYTRIDPTSFSF
jgi:hypothetical protein